MRIDSILQLHAAQPLNSPHHSPASQPLSQSSLAPVDQLDISAEAQDISQARESHATQSSDIRQDRVAEIRRQIEQGIYETPEKLDAAVDRLLSELVG